MLPNSLSDLVARATREKLTFHQTRQMAQSQEHLQTSDAFLMKHDGFRKAFTKLWVPDHPSLDELLAMPAFSLGQTLGRFLNHYGLQPAFFSVAIEISSDTGPTAYAAYRLNQCYDFFMLFCSMRLVI